MNGFGPKSYRVGVDESVKVAALKSYKGLNGFGSLVHLTSLFILLLKIFGLVSIVPRNQWPCSSFYFDKG